MTASTVTSAPVVAVVFARRDGTSALLRLAKNAKTARSFVASLGAADPRVSVSDETRESAAALGEPVDYAALVASEGPAVVASEPAAPAASEAKEETPAGETDDGGSLAVAIDRAGKEAKEETPADPLAGPRAALAAAILAGASSEEVATLAAALVASARPSAVAARKATTSGARGRPTRFAGTTIRATGTATRMNPDSERSRLLAALPAAGETYESLVARGFRPNEVAYLEAKGYVVAVAPVAAK